jgi:hypothetical protein
MNRSRANLPTGTTCCWPWSFDTSIWSRWYGGVPRQAWPRLLTTFFPLYSPWLPFPAPQKASLRIDDELAAQQRWVQTIKPRDSLLKYSLPWRGGATEFFDGDRRFPIWGGQTAADARIWVERDAPLRSYNNKEHENLLYYFNTVTRVALYCPGLGAGTSLDGCYDCTAEIVVIAKYVRAHGWPGHTEPLGDEVRATLSLQVDCQSGPETDDKPLSCVQFADEDVVGKYVADFSCVRENSVPPLLCL